MEFKKRRIGDPIPHKMVIRDGGIVMTDGSCLKEYLQEWQEQAGIKNNTAITIYPAAVAEKVEGLAVLAKGWGA